MAFKMDSMIDAVVGFLVVVAIAPAVLSIYFNNVSTSGWDASTIAIWGILGILFIVAMIYFFIPRRGKGR